MKTRLTAIASLLSLLAVGVFAPFHAGSARGDRPSRLQLVTHDEGDQADSSRRVKPATVGGEKASAKEAVAEETPADASTPDADDAAVELSPRMAALRDRIRRVNSHYQQNQLLLNTRDNNSWEVMHAVVAYGVDTLVRIDHPQGEQQTAVGWLCYNRSFSGYRMLTLYNGRPLGVRAYGMEGHHGQLLAILAQARLKPDYPIRVADGEFTLQDLIENEKSTCRAREELTFKLIGLAYYLPSDATWKAIDGQPWSISRLVREEIRQPIQGAACGGTHRLMGLSYAFKRREKEGLPIDGDFARAKKFIEDYHEYAFRLQNGDGSFSTQWLEYRQARSSLDRRVQTSGHILEWLAYSLTDKQLREARTLKAVEYLSRLLDENRDRRWEVGPLAHAVHALVIYDRRVFGRPPKATAPLAAEKVEVETASDERSILRSDDDSE